MRLRPLRKWLSVSWTLVSDTIDEYSRDRADLMAAALAFYTLLSMAPLILVAVAIAGTVLGTSAARTEISRLLDESMGASAAATVNQWVDEAGRSGQIASIIGAVLVLFAASRLVGQLRSAINQAWNADEVEVQGLGSSIKDFLRRRLFAFAMVLASGPLLLGVFASRALLTGLHQVLFGNSPIAGVAIQLAQIAFSLVLVALMTAVVFRVLPDARMPWRSIWAGALLTSVLFNVGNILVGLYLGRATVAATYGAAGSLVVVLLWLNYSASMFLLGAEFTQVHAKRSGWRAERAPAQPDSRRARPPASQDGSRPRTAH
ncbi:MAG TPA: YihY/virulence factor BrkB family protein [Polyangiaceae bacterium]